MSLLNKKQVRAFILDYAARNRFHKFERVNGASIDSLEGVMREAIRKRVDSLPSKGKTIKFDW